LFEESVTLAPAVVEETALDDVADFLDALGLQVPGLGVGDVLLNRLFDRGNLLADDGRFVPTPPSREPCPERRLTPSG
jgi:hypothetical protein